MVSHNYPTVQSYSNQSYLSHQQNQTTPMDSPERKDLNKQRQTLDESFELQYYPQEYEK